MKKSNFNERLALNKVTITNLNDTEMKKLYGGYTDGSCYQHCLDATTVNSFKISVCD
jgi:natural product precursor